MEQKINYQALKIRNELSKKNMPNKIGTIDSFDIINNIVICNINNQRLIDTIENIVMSIFKGYICVDDIGILATWSGIERA